MLTGKITNLQASAAPIALSPDNRQTQLSSVTVRLPTQAPTNSSAQQRRSTSKARSSQAPTRMNEVTIFNQAIIGSGSYGIVYRASCHPFKSLALKVCYGKPARLAKELTVLTKCAEETSKNGSRAIHIPQVYFAAWSDSDPSLLIIGMELCLPLTLHDYLHHESYPLEVGMYLAQEVVEAVAYVHKCKCIHRDVKLQNFVFSIDGRLKLIDFGIATDSLAPPPGDVTAGTIAFMSPEMATNVLCTSRDDRGVVGAPADVWSVGTVLFCIFVQGDLYTTSDEDPQTPGNDVDAVLLHRVAQGQWRWPPNVERNVPKPFRDLITRCLKVSPSDRPTMASILKESCWKKTTVVPETIKKFLAVDSLGVDAEGSLRVEGASVRKSPFNLIGRGSEPTPKHDNQITLNAPRQGSIPMVNSPQGAAKSPNTIVTELLSPLQALSALKAGPEGTSNPQVNSRLSVSRALLTDGSPGQFRPPPALPPPTPQSTTVVKKTYTLDEILLGLASPIKDEEVQNKVENPVANSRAVPKISPALLKKKISKALSAPILKDEQAARDRLVKLRTQEMEDLTSLFRCQSNNFKHPHHFKFHEKPMNKSYSDGYMCDECGVFFAPKKGWMPYFHCSCGSDLCEQCHQNHVILCTCVSCGTMLDNYQSLIKHQAKCKGPRRSSQSLGIKRGRSQGDIGKDDARVSGARPPRTEGRSSRSVSRRRGGRDPSAGATETQFSTVPASSIPLVTEPVALNPVSPSEPWSPFENRQKAFAASHDETTATMPTEAERAIIIGEEGSWVRYFHYYPEQSEAEVFAYCIQPGRAGGIFLSNTSTIHSAVVAAVESKILVVDFVDVQTGRDRSRLLSLHEGKAAQPTSVQALLDIYQHDSNLLKQKRAVGTTSVCQRPQVYLDCFGKPFVYVRWVKHDLDNKLVAFGLSNGAFQVFVQEQCEIRWTSGGRKFKVSPHGVCEFLDEATFNEIPALVKLFENPN